MAAAADPPLQNLKLWQDKFSVDDSMPPLGIVTHILEPLFSYISYIQATKDNTVRESKMEVVDVQEDESKMEVEAESFERAADSEESLHKSFERARYTANKFEEQVTALADAFAELVPYGMHITKIEQCYTFAKASAKDLAKALANDADSGGVTEEDESFESRDIKKIEDIPLEEIEEVVASQGTDIDQPAKLRKASKRPLLLTELEKLFDENTFVTDTYENMMLQLNMTYDEVFNIDEWHSMLDYLMDLKVVQPQYSRYSRERKADYTIENGKLDIKEEEEEKSFKFGLKWRQVEDDFTKVDDLYTALLNYTFNKQLIHCLAGNNIPVDVGDYIKGARVLKFQRIVSKFSPNEYLISAIPNPNRIMNAVEEKHLMIDARAAAKRTGDVMDVTKWKKVWNDTYTKKRHRAASKIQAWWRRSRQPKDMIATDSNFDFAIKKEWQAAIEAIAMYNV